MIQLGTTILALRKHRKIKQYELAEALGISGTYLSMVEKNVRKPSLNLLRKIAGAFGMQMSDIFFAAITRGNHIPADIVLAGPTVDIILEYLLQGHPEE